MEQTAFTIPQSPVALLGTVSVLVAYLVAAYGAAAGLIGNLQQRRKLVESAIYGLYALAAVMTLASALIVYAFVTHDFTIRYVANYSDLSMPLSYLITAYWGGLDGSMMLWIWVLSLFSALAVYVNRERHRDMIGFVVATILVVQLFFLSILVYAKNPFATFLSDPPADGKGLTPLLQNYWMVIHPPSLYIGFVSATIPYAFAMGALASRRLDDRWLASIRSWTLVCWFFLSLGLILGGRWAYEELGWGGYWAWDPVENAGMIPWFTATAFLHSIIVQEQRGMMKVWNLVLVILTFFFTIFGTFMTRAGFVQSVHAFGEDAELALFFILFLSAITIISMGLLFFRLPQLRCNNTFESFFSREAAFVLNNYVLLACALFVLFVTLFPTTVEHFTGNRISIGPEFFNKWMTPAGLTLVLLSGAAPLLAWRRTTPRRLGDQFLLPATIGVLTMAALVLLLPNTRVRTPIYFDQLRLPISLINFGIVAFTIVCILQEFWKGTRVRMRQTGGAPFTSLVGLTLAKRRKYGGYLVHMAIAIMFVGFAGKAYETEQDFTLTGTGQTFHLRGYTFLYEDLQVRANDHVRGVVAKVRVFGDREMTDERAVLLPEHRKFLRADQATTEVAISTSFLEDIYIVLNGYDESEAKVANMRVFINPLVNWVWLGFGLMIIGTALCLLPPSLVSGLSPRRRRGAGTALLVLVAGGLLAAMAVPARAQGASLARSAEHVEETSPHEVTLGAAHLFPPNSETADRVMHDLLCMCGGCKRETIRQCSCAAAAQERGRVLELLAGADLSTEAARQLAYDRVVAAFVAEHGEAVLASPRSRLPWLLPSIVIAGGVLLLVGVGRAWVRRGRDALARASQPSPPDQEEDSYAELLDDELRETD